MKLQILSDIHLEYGPLEMPSGGSDAVILAGDIAEGAQGVLWARKTFRQPVIYVCGNHEYHDPCCSMAEHLAAMKSAAEGSNVVLLDNEIVVIGGVRFLGSTMWTDLSRFGSVLYCDHDNIVVEDELGHAPVHFTVEQQQALFDRNRAWIGTQLASPFDGKTVVITHHAPSLKSLHPKYAGNPWNPCFMTDMEALMPGVELWVHGHTHSSFDYRIGKTRVICNPRGYPERGCEWENQEFNLRKIVEV